MKIIFNLILGLILAICLAGIICCNNPPEFSHRGRIQALVRLGDDRAVLLTTPDRRLYYFNARDDIEHFRRAGINSYDPKEFIQNSKYPYGFTPSFLKDEYDIMFISRVDNSAFWLPFSKENCKEEFGGSFYDWIFIEIIPNKHWVKIPKNPRELKRFYGRFFDTSHFTAKELVNGSSPGV